MKSLLRKGIDALKKRYDAGMRIKFDGLHTLQDLEMMIHEAFAKSRDSGVHNASAASFYINLCDSNGSLVRLREFPRNVMVMKEPYRSIAQDHGI